jgi:hypothetical protein
MVRARTPEGKERLAYRKGSIERLFAQLFYHQKFRHFTMRGLHKAGTQLFILCAAHNLWVLASRMTQLLGNEGIKELQKQILGPFDAFFAICERLLSPSFAILASTQN